MRIRLAVLLSVLTVPLRICGQRLDGEKAYELPCHPELLAPSGDGTTVWFACQEISRETTQFVTRGFRPTTVYALALGSGRLSELCRLSGIDRIVAAPVGDQFIVVFPDENRRDETVLYRRNERVSTLPIDPWMLVWSTDAEHIFFRGGSTLQAEAWNILGVLRLKDLAVSKRTLLEPTESIYMCPATGHIFTGYAEPDRRGKLKGRSAVDYGPDLNRPTSVKNFPPAPSPRPAGMSQHQDSFTARYHGGSSTRQLVGS